ncbi:hypothetical protein D3C79_813720 [compost metagenome]
MHKRNMQGAAQFLTGQTVQLGDSCAHLFAGQLVGHQTADAQRQIADRLAAFNHGDPAVHGNDPVDRGHHIGVIGAGDNDVVGIMGHTFGDGAGLQLHAADEGFADLAAAAMPLDNE